MTPGMSALHIHFFSRFFSGIYFLLMCRLVACPLALVAQSAIPVTVVTAPGLQGSKTPDVLIRPDTGNVLAPQQAWAQFEKGLFQPFAPSLLPGKFEYERFTFWAVFSVENRSDSLLDLLVRIEHYRDTIWKVQQGRLMPVAHIPKLFPVPLARPLLPYDVRTLSCIQFYPRARDTFLMKIRHYRPHTSFLPVLYDPSMYEIERVRSVQYTSLFYFLLFGVLFTVFWFCVSQFIYQRDAAYLWFALYLFSLLLVTWRNIETENPWLYSTYYLAPWYWTKTIFSSVHFCFYTLFIHRFLQKEGESTVITHRIVRVILGISLIAVALEWGLLLADAFYESWLLYNVNRLTLTLLSIWILGRLWRNRKYALTRFLLAATLIALLGELLSLLLIYPASTLVSGLGILLQIAILSFGLAYRSNEFQMEFRRLQTRHIWQLEENQRLSLIARREEIESFKNRFYANMTHEFRTPLTIIMGMADTLKAHADAQVRNTMAVLIRNSQNLLHLVNQLLRLSKVESGLIQMRVEYADVMQFIKITGQSFVSLATLQGQHLHVSVVPDHYQTNFDADFLQQILSNLIGNALKYTGPGGKIHVKGYIQTSVPNPALIIEVNDTGKGISERAMPFIFDRFHQGDQDSNLLDGVGLGLALVKELVDHLDGTIQVKSKVGEGTTFRILLPLQAESRLLENNMTKPVLPGAQPESATDAWMPNAELPVLLLVEDNQDLVQYLSAILTKNYQVLHAADGEAGYETALQSLPDIILSDLMMPALDGFGLCSKLKNDHRTSHIPVVMLTARASTEDKVKGLQTGVDAWLVKPFHREELLATLSAMVESRRRLRMLLKNNDPSVKDAYSPWIEKEKAFLEQLNAAIEVHLSDSEYDVSRLSRDMAMSRMQLHRKLKTLGEPSPALYIRAYRLSRAKTLLTSTDDTVAQIAYQTGFNDPAYFSNCFREAYDVSPSEWRKEPT
ncbi:MAG: response regulator [Saprospiraceae bacterium]|nr:response regulator [Saprospiraceae bacterium]